MFPYFIFTAITKTLLQEVASIGILLILQTVLKDFLNGFTIRERFNTTQFWIIKNICNANSKILKKFNGEYVQTFKIAKYD